jgi:AraC-like DNA-binding protein
MSFASLAPRLARLERERPAQDLVENRVTFGAERASFAVYDTVRPAERVPLSAPNPLFCAMVTGRKLVHTSGGSAIPFLPSESLVVPSGQTIAIDFPGASEHAPTKCFAIEIDRSRVRSAATRLAETAPDPAAHTPTYDDAHVCHFANTRGIERTVRRLADAFLDDDPDKDVFIDLGVHELVVRMLRMQARRLLLSSSAPTTESQLAAAAAYARARLDEPLRVADLASAACMSEPAFYRAFQHTFGLTPMAYVTEQRVRRARALLVEPGRSVSEAAAAVGFASVSHFIRVFREHIGQTPKQYQLASARRAVA